MNMCNLYGVPYTFLDELLTFLLANLLPQGNNMTRNTYETKQMIMKLGLEHVQIHCCLNGHILYESEDTEDLTKCSKCKHPQYV